MPNGNIYTGKHRLYPKVKDCVIENVNKKLALEEQNMFYLRHPYLTLEQSWGHATAMGKGKEFIQRKTLEKEKWMEDVTIESRYATLNNKDVWDC
ncbi:hypothetical protein Pmani_003072 [Petrolisthes manimaculis]|uniref:Ribosomal protein 63, mitochondrial n=1 Tax=Petrolisthes manimaculis TaxID=1843537 RepID=A0AAE1UQD6_9EUCA|nr:hypothetical protein Pmani_003072 [Petrolisthes manimaculis]